MIQDLHSHTYYSFCGKDSPSAIVEAAIDGVSGEVMIFVRSSTEPYCCEICHEKVTKIANQTKYVPDEFINETADNVTDECCKYLLPLICGECDVIYNNGLPKHIIF